MVQLFRLQITYPDGEVVEVYPGTPMEADLIAACTEAIVRRGVGFLKTEQQVKTAISAGISEVFTDLKGQTVAVIRRGRR